MEKEGNTALYLFHQGTNDRAYHYLGAHREGGRCVFRVWAPHADAVFAVGDFNGWRETCPLSRVSGKGVFEGGVPEAEVPEGCLYKFLIYTPNGAIYKADPYAFQTQRPPETASVFCDPFSYPWQDEGWMRYRAESAKNFYALPLNIYEMHALSWKRRADGSPLCWGELAAELAPYLKQMGYTHVELLPVAEHPFEGSWGYQITGYFAPTARLGTPREFAAFVDAMHGAGTGVILDWVPAHFPKDAHGLFEFDGAPLYEYQGKDRMEHHGWGTRCFDVGREEVQSFLISNAAFWAEVYHIDGLRVDAVSSMLYLDYDRAAGEWVPNVYGDNRNLEAIAFLRKLTDRMRAAHPDVLMIAEESTAYPAVTGDPPAGLGFSLKWNMGWMNDALDYAAAGYGARKYRHNKTTFSLTYAFSERFLLPVSHDEVVHGKRSLLDRMPGKYAEKFAGVRAFLGYMMTHPGKKLLFMGCEIGQFCEWDYGRAVEWFLLSYDSHAALQRYVAALNNFYLATPALYECDDSFAGFVWIDPDNAAQSVLSYCRRDARGGEVTVILNFSPEKRENFRQGLPARGEWEEVFNSDRAEFGGGGIENSRIVTEDIPFHGLPQSAALTLPPLSVLVLRCRRKFPPKRKYTVKRVEKIPNAKGERKR